MLNKLFSKPLTLTIGGQNISFDTLAEFEFCLAGRTDVPAKKIAALVLLSPEDLKREAKSIKSIERQFVDILQKSIESPGSIATHLREMDAHVFSQDHSWREIIASLSDKGADYDELRRVALVKYMQYLTSRQEVIKHTYAVKRQRPLDRDVGVGPSRMGETMMIMAPSMDNGHPFNPAMRETVILDPALVEHEPKKEEMFRRLPKGEGVVLRINAPQTVELMLSKHPFKLGMNEHLVLVDDSGTSHRLLDGKNIIGRDTVCNVIVNGGFRDVSRLHLIIERIAPDLVRFTDLSSHGTFLPSGLLSQIVESD